MKMIHTADWHLCDRLGRLDRTTDLMQRVERVAAYCQEEAVDVLAIAGDLFFEDARPEEMADALNHVNRTFRPFFDRGGTILAVTGNHDRDQRIDLVRAGMALAAAPTATGSELQPGRMYLLNRCFYGTLRVAAGDRVQFVLVPYPFAHRYNLADKFQSREELNAQLQARVAEWVQSIPNRDRFDPTLPTVLIAHLHVSGAQIRTLYRITPRDDVVIEPGFLQGTWAYVALGHIHQPQHLPGTPAIRYSGPLDRLDFGEREDERGVWLVDIGPIGLRDEPRWLPLKPTPMLDLVIRDANDLTTAACHPERQAAIVRVTVTSSQLHRDEVTRSLRNTFPRLHEIYWAEDRPPVSGVQADHENLYSTADLAGTVRRYLERELPPGHPHRHDLLNLAEQFIAEELHRDPPAR
jgi:exonuclease SbcD